MEKNVRRLVLLFSLILVFIPTVIFPNRLGAPLGSGSAVNLLYEMVFYGIVLYLFRRDTTLVALTAGTALTLVYRLAIGAVFSLTIVIMYGMNTSIAFSLGMGKYLPGVIIQALAAPFVMRSVYLSLSDEIVGTRKRLRRMPAETPEPVAHFQHPAPETTSQPLPQQRFEEVGSTPAPQPWREDHVPSNANDENLFERAVMYLAESGAVKMALVVDAEGLTLAKFNRSEYDIDCWAPMAVVIENNNREVLSRFAWKEDPERIDVGTRNLRIILRRIDHVTLMILADQNIDETIHIRLAQASDMIRKYLSERYSPALFVRAEGRYVSNS